MCVTNSWWSFTGRPWRFMQARRSSERVGLVGCSTSWNTLLASEMPGLVKDWSAISTVVNGDVVCVD